MEISPISPPITSDPTALMRMAQSESMPEAGKIEAATEQFEAVFLRQYLGEALKPIFKGCLDESGSGTDIYRYMLSDSLASSMSSQGVFGVADHLQQQLSPVGSDNSNISKEKES